jgi:hypothetical protein
LFNQFFRSARRAREASDSDANASFIPTGCVNSLVPRRPKTGRFTLIWILVLLIAILAIAGGLAISKFLFILLVIAVIVALLGARSAA